MTKLCQTLLNTHPVKVSYYKCLRFYVSGHQSCFRISEFSLHTSKLRVLCSFSLYILIDTMNLVNKVINKVSFRFSSLNLDLTNAKYDCVWSDDASLISISDRLNTHIFLRFIFFRAGHNTDREVGRTSGLFVVWPLQQWFTYFVLRSMYLTIVRMLYFNSENFSNQKRLQSVLHFVFWGVIVF